METEQSLAQGGQGREAKVSGQGNSRIDTEPDQRKVEEEIKILQNTEAGL